LKLWEVTSGRDLRTFKGHSGTVNGVAFSPDGRTLLSGSDDGALRRWTSKGDRLVTSFAASDGEWLTMTEEGFFDASPNGAKLLSVVRGLDVYSIEQFFQALYRPDLVRQKLSGDFDDGLRVELAGRKLNLEKVLNSGEAPKITIASPENDSKTSDINVTIEVNVANQGGGIGRVEWRVNGVTLGVQNLSVSASPVGGDARISRTIALGEGTNVIEVVAYNFQNLIASLPAAVAVTVSPTMPRPPSRLHVLAVGINEYLDKALKLKFATRDARAISEAFRLPNAGDRLYEQIVVHQPVLDGEVTLQNLQKVFENLSKSVRPNDVFVLYMAGHGVTEDGRYYFIPQDAKEQNDEMLLKNSIGQDQLQEWLTRVPALKSVLIYDTCESGSTAEERSGFRGEQQLVAAEKLSRSMGRTVLAATTDTAPAKEGYKGHGIFTYAVLTALSLGDENKNGRIEIRELATYLQTNLPKLSELAGFLPQLAQVKIIGSDFALVNRANISDIDAIRK
jgi:hypothetical protein